MVSHRSRLPALLGVLGTLSTANAQHPIRHFVDAFEVRFDRADPVVTYVLRIDENDLAAFDVEIEIRNAPDSFRLAMAAHPEYDDRFWRHVEGLTVQSPGGRAPVARVDSAIWQVVAPGGRATVRYRIRLPASTPGPRAAWRPFLSPTGALVGGPHSFMYVLGAERAPAHVRLDLPADWETATGLMPTSDSRTFFAPSVDVLVDSPIFTGRFHTWRFEIDGAPHRVVYWPAPAATPFDTVAFVSGIEQLAGQAVSLFGRVPYREYVFVFQDEAYGGLEHLNSVTLGARSAELARNPAAHLQETAHEYIHTWNLMRIRPEEYRGVDFRTQAPTAGLWFSEGLTMFYADLLLRRAGLPARDSTRTGHLEWLVGRYLASPGNWRFSAEAVSRVEYNAPPGALGDYSASTHLQGELIGAMLDLAVRDATDGARSMDDVMRLMLERFAGERGFDGAGVQRAVEDVCACSVSDLFDGHVRNGGAPIPFDRYLGRIGLRVRVNWAPAVWQGEPERDLRVWAWEAPGDSGLRLVVSDPGSIWGKAGLHTGDRVMTINDSVVTTWAAFRGLVGGLRMGDTVRVQVARAEGPFQATVVITGFERPVARIEELPEMTARQRALREAWLQGG